MYDDPPEPTEEEMDEFNTEQAVANAPTVRIEGLTAEAVAVIVRQAVESQYRLAETARETVNDHVRKITEELTKEIAREQIAILVTQVLDEGFVEHDRYGNGTGKQITAQSLILEQLSARSSDSYGAKAQTPAERIAKEVIDSRFMKEFSAEIERAKAGFRAQVDELLKGKLVASLKDALGLR